MPGFQYFPNDRFQTPSVEADPFKARICRAIRGTDLQFPANLLNHLCSRKQLHEWQTETRSSKSALALHEQLLSEGLQRLQSEGAEKPVNTIDCESEQQFSFHCQSYDGYK